jgi:hypothetical protein
VLRSPGWRLYSSVSSLSSLAGRDTGSTGHGFCGSHARAVECLSAEWHSPSAVSVPCVLQLPMLEFFFASIDASRSQLGSTA